MTIHVHALVVYVHGECSVRLPKGIEILRCVILGGLLVEHVDKSQPLVGYMPLVGLYDMDLMRSMSRCGAPGRLRIRGTWGARGRRQSRYSLWFFYGAKGRVRITYAWRLTILIFIR